MHCQESRNVAVGQGKEGERSQGDSFRRHVFLDHPLGKRYNCPKRYILDRKGKSMTDLKMQVLWNYYTAVAADLGVKKLSDGTSCEQPYSVRWYFDEHSLQRNVLTRAFLGDAEAMALVRRGILEPEAAEVQQALYGGRGSAIYREEDFLEADSRNPPPDEAQAEAIKAALSMPISFIKGPPGSGKTSGILHLLSCILCQGKTVAMVSSNNSAIASGVNANPEGVKPGWLKVFKAIYQVNRSPLFALMLTEPNITAEMLQDIRIPVTIFGADRDMIQKEHMEEIAMLIPKGVYREVRHANHSS